MQFPPKTDEDWMREALRCAQTAEQHGEVPVGAVMVKNDALIAEGWNQPIGACDPTAHAEIVALRQAAQKLHNYRLQGVTLYVTLEPCAMCLGAMIHARIDRLVYGATDPKAGVVESVIALTNTVKFNHVFTQQGGVLAEPCGQVLSDFFAKKRQQYK